MSLALTLPSPPGEGEDRPRIAAPPPQFPLLGERARVRVRHSIFSPVFGL